MGRGWRMVESTRKGALSVTPLRSPPRVRLAGHCPGSLTKDEGAAPAQWPAHAMQTLPRWRWGEWVAMPNTMYLTL
jgi:hypothetical protein